MPVSKPAAPHRRVAATGDRGGLAEYQARRNFSTSPEPSARSPAKRLRQRRFCVQKHLASHLHYDFRLEHRGVLCSWAVPKGPSTDPTVKRLAMQVEDHPVGYGTFEGVIPSGYGAGIVTVWDAGVWEPLIDDVDEALAAGKLPFVLLGKRLQGAWTLLRTARTPRAWLLIKQRDRWSRAQDEADDDIETFAQIVARQSANPWPANPPVRSGATGELFQHVLVRAAKLAGKSWGSADVAKTPRKRRR